MTDATYAILDRVLQSLGFVVRRLDDDTRAYNHAASGALIVLPTLPDSATVLPRHFVGVRMTLDAFGIADPPDFAARLQQAS